MPLTSKQICAQAAAIAKTTGVLSQVGQTLNLVLAELCQTYDFDFCRGTYVFNLNPGSSNTAQYPNLQPGSGPYNLPADYLRTDQREMMWFLNGVPYPMEALDLWEFDRLIQSANSQGYPACYATDIAVIPPVLVIWPPASGGFLTMDRYRRQMPDIGSGGTWAANQWNPGTDPPETSATVPWFPLQGYLITRTAGEQMKSTNDDRWKIFLGEGPEGAQGILNRYLKLDNDNSNRAKKVTLDQRYFGPKFSRLPNTKSVGWGPN